MDDYSAFDTSFDGETLKIEKLKKKLSDVQIALNEASILAITDQKGIIKFVNDKFCEMSQYSREELIGQDHRVLNSGYHSKEFFKDMWRTIGSGETWKGEIRNKAKDGSFYWVQTTIVPYLNVQGKPYKYVALRTDITERKKAEAELQKALMDDFRHTVKNLQNGVFKLKKREDGSIIYTMLEGKLLEKINLSTETHYGKTPYEIFSPEIAQYKNFHYEKAFEGNIVNYELEINERILRCELSPIKQNEVIIEVVGSVHDLTELKMTKRKLRENEQLYHTLFEQSVDSVLSFDSRGNFLKITPNAEAMLGYTTEELRSISFSAIILEDYKVNTLYHFDKAIKGEPQNYETVLIHKTGSFIYLNMTNSPIIVDNEVIGIYVIGKDITEQKRIQEENAYLAHHDELTKLPNRRFFQQKLGQAMIEASSENKQLAIMYLDMDRFKYINDTLGHTVGDRLLEQISLRLHLRIPNHALLARMGGDEFMILCPEIENTEVPIELAQNLLSSLAEPFVIDEFDLYITGSIGISVYPTDGENAEDLMKHADIALYRAKDQGRNMYQIYSTSMNAKTYQSFLLEKDLRKALIQNEFQVYFQPRVDSQTGKILSAEALLRWKHPQLGMISPSEFIPLAEETGLILPINSWVKKKVCEQLVQWRERGIPLLPISINMTSQRFLQKDFSKAVVQLLEQYQLEGKWLEFEITENSLMKNEDFVIQTLDELRRMGIRIFIDDFGTGYSSFSYLKSFKLDGIKIDRSFIRNISIESDNAAITTAMINMAHHLNMEVVAEGVETEEELLFLRGQNCDQIQGFLFSKPLPVEEFEMQVVKGYLSPVLQQRNVYERRKHVRIQMENSLLANMTIVKIRGRDVSVGKSEVLIEDISPGGLRFLSNVKLIFNPDIVFSFETQVLGQKIQLFGRIVWNKEGDQGIHQFGVEFSMTESQRTPFTQLLNEFSHHLRNHSWAPECRFIKTSKTNFFKLKGA